MTANGAALVRHQTPDLHIIGQGSGAIVASEAIERLAAYQIAVDHLTYLDPHDFDQGLVTDASTTTDFAGQPGGYGAVVWDNVDFADVYYQTRGANNSTDQVTDTLVPEGRPIPGAVNYWIGPGGLNYLPDPAHNAHPADYKSHNVLGDHRYLWEGFYLSTITGLSPQGNAAAGLTKDTPQPADAIPLDDIGYAFSRVRQAEPRPVDQSYFAYRDQGTWQTGTLYHEFDLVQFNSNQYAANKIHTSNGPNAPGGANWDLLPSSPLRQDHRHSPASIANTTTGVPNFAGLFGLGFSVDSITDARRLLQAQ